jgi:phosphohistidine phosphatase
MKTLLLLRHAKSSRDDPQAPDHERGLNERGKRSAIRMGNLLVKEKLVPDIILTSSARRAQNTCSLLVERSSYRGEVLLRNDFYAAEPKTIIKGLRDLADDYQSAMVIGHNPGLEELLLRLTGKVESLPTAALAQVSLPIHHWRELSLDSPGKLQQIWRPRELD